MAKGQDGFSPVGPAMAAADVDPATLHLTGLVNGEVRQDTTGADLIFSFAQLIADLSRFMTLEPGDVILTGTPAGASVVVPGDVVEVRLEGAGSVTSTIVAGAAELAPYGAMPRATADARAFATGANPPPPSPPAPPRPVVLSDDALAALRQVSTATLDRAADPARDRDDVPEWSAAHALGPADGGLRADAALCRDPGRRARSDEGRGGRAEAGGGVGGPG